MLSEAELRLAEVRRVEASLPNPRVRKRADYGDPSTQFFVASDEESLRKTIASLGGSLCGSPLFNTVESFPKRLCGILSGCQSPFRCLGIFRETLP